MHMQGQAVLWIGQVPDKFFQVAPDIIHILSSRERRKYFRIRSEKDRLRFLFARYLLRQALSAMLDKDVAPEKWSFSSTGSGKPVIAGGMGLPSLYFNLSYAGRLVTVAVSATWMVGVDIEQVPCRNDVEIDVALSAGERERLYGLPPADRLRTGLRIWTIKEAYAKLLGRGLTLDFSALEVGLSPVRLLRDEQGQRDSDDLCLMCHSLYLQGEEYSLSLAARPAHRSVDSATMH